MICHTVYHFAAERAILPAGAVAARAALSHTRRCPTHNSNASHRHCSNIQHSKSFLASPPRASRSQKLLARSASLAQEQVCCVKLAAAPPISRTVPPKPQQLTHPTSGNQAFLAAPELLVKLIALNRSRSLLLLTATPSRQLLQRR